MNCLKTYKFSDLYDLSSGISTKPSQAGHGYPFCSFTTIFNNPILPEELPELMATSDEERKTYSIKEGDVLLTRTSETLNELAMSSVALKDYENATFSGFAKRLRPKSKEAYPKFMAFFFRSKYFRKIINNKAIMTLRASFNENIFNDIYFQLPEYSVQKDIGDFFYNIELKIRNNNIIASKLKKLAEHYFNYFFIQFNCSSYFNKAKDKLKYNEKLNIEIPIGWDVKNIRSIIKNEIGGDWGEGKIIAAYKHSVCCIRGTDIEGINNGSFSPLQKRYITDKKLDRLLKNGDYVVEISGTPGRSTYINNNLLERYNKKVIASNFCHAFSFNNKNFLYWFDFYWKRLYKNGTIKCFTEKTTISNLLFDSFVESVYLPIPPDNVLEEFNKIVEPLFEKVQNLYNQNLRLEQLRKFLFDFLLTGQAKLK